jgi:pimeloyl-ACP methyl ester carboxylesterase
MRYSTRGRKSNLPLLIIGSKGDRLVALECIKKTHEALGGTLVWHPSSGHGLPLDQPIWLSLAISKWIKSNEI